MISSTKPTVQSSVHGQVEMGAECTNIAPVFLRFTADSGYLLRYRGNRFDNTADPVVTGWDQWVCPHSDEVYEDCLWDHPTTDVAKRMITPYEWHELPR